MYLSIVEKQAQMMMLNIFKVFPTPTVTVVRNKDKLFQKPGNKKVLTSLIYVCALFSLLTLQRQPWSIILAQKRFKV